jgi:hypothetical protein
MYIKNPQRPLGPLSHPRLHAKLLPNARNEFDSFHVPSNSPIDRALYFFNAASYKLTNTPTTAPICRP